MCWYYFFYNHLHYCTKRYEDVGEYNESTNIIRIKNELIMLYNNVTNQLQIRVKAFITYIVTYN